MVEVTVSRSEIFGMALLVLCSIAFILLFVVEDLAVHRRIQLAFILLLVASCAILGMYPS